MVSNAFIKDRREYYIFPLFVLLLVSRAVYRARAATARAATPTRLDTAPFDAAPVNGARVLVGLAPVTAPVPDGLTPVGAALPVGYGTEEKPAAALD